MSRPLKISVERTHVPHSELKLGTWPARSQKCFSRDGARFLEMVLDPLNPHPAVPRCYHAAIYGQDGQLQVDFGPRRFLSVDGESPWCPTSPLVALPELLSNSLVLKGKISRMNIFDASRQTTIAAWDCTSLIARMWREDGKYYLFQEGSGIYLFCVADCSLRCISSSFRCHHCFVLKEGYIFVFYRDGYVAILDDRTGDKLAEKRLPLGVKYSPTIYSVEYEPREDAVRVVLMGAGLDADGVCYSIRVRSADRI